MCLIVPVASSLFNNSLHVCDVSQEQGHVQHALGHRLLCGVQVHVQIRSRTSLKKRFRFWISGDLSRLLLPQVQRLPSTFVGQTMENSVLDSEREGHSAFIWGNVHSFFLHMPVRNP